MSLYEVVGINLKNKKTPIMMETPLSEGLDGPFLVSSSKGFMWVESKFPGNFIRSATRKVTPYNLYKESCIEISNISKERGWGSVKPFTDQGLKDALEYLRYFGFSEFDMFQNSDSKSVTLDYNIEGLHLNWEDWVPENMAIIAPVDKSYLGTLYSFGGGNFACCVHNPSRGICILS